MRKKREWLTFDLTPLIDIVFLLLIFFMVFSVFKKDEFILNIDLPIANASEEEKNNKKIIIELNEEYLSFNGKKVTFDTLETQCNNFAPNAIVLLSIDKHVVYDKVVKLLNILKAKHIENISLLVKQ